MLHHNIVQRNGDGGRLLHRRMPPPLPRNLGAVDNLEWTVPIHGLPVFRGRIHVVRDRTERDPDDAKWSLHRRAGHPEHLGVHVHHAGSRRLL